MVQILREKEKDLNISSALSFFFGFIIAGMTVWFTFFYSALRKIPIISDLIRPPSYLTYNWVGVRLIIIGGLGVVISFVVKMIWYMYQQKKGD